MKSSLFLYSKSNCPLCDEFKAGLDDNGVRYNVVNIDDDLELIQRFGARVPVLISGNSVICEGQLDLELLQLCLQSANQ